MEDFNIVPSTGTFGNAMGVVNQNFELAKEQIDKVSKMKENSLGLFASRENLVSAYPSPQKGQFAYVGNSEPFAIYKCVTDGEWPSTSSGTWDGGTIDLNDFATKDTTDTLFANIKYFSVPQSAFNNGVITLTIEAYKLFVGGSIKLKMGFVLSSGVGVKMNINNTGEKELYYNGSNISSLNSWKQNEIIEVFYDGEKFMAYKLFDRKILDSISDSLYGSLDVSTIGAVINFVNSKLAEGYIYAGIATPSSTPTTGRVFYLALTAGTYTNYGNKVVTQGINILKYNGSAWSLDVIASIDDAPTPSSNNLIKSGGAFDFVMKNGSAFDLSAYNNGTTYADLNAALTALNALPAAYKKGGMSIKFVQTSDNKYVQYRLIANTFSTSESDWQGVDVMVMVGSTNLIESGAVAEIQAKRIKSITTAQANKYIDSEGTVKSANGYSISNPISLKDGETIEFICYAASTSYLSQYLDGAYIPIYYGSIPQNTKVRYRVTNDIDVVVCGATMSNICTIYTESAPLEEVERIANVVDNPDTNVPVDDDNKLITGGAVMKALQPVIEFEQASGTLTTGITSEVGKTYLVYVFDDCVISDTGVEVYCNNYYSSEDKLVVTETNKIYEFTPAHSTEIRVYNNNIENHFLIVEKTSSLKNIIQCLVSTVNSIKSSRVCKLNISEWNIGYWNNGVQHQEGNPYGVPNADIDTYLPRVKSLLTKLCAEILVITEWVTYFDQDYTMLSYDTVFKQFYPYQYNRGNNKPAIYSKYPIIGSEGTFITAGETYTKGVVVLCGIQVVICAIHLPSAEGDRNTRMQMISDIITEYADIPYVIVVGDTNIYNTDELQAFITAGWVLGNCGYWGNIDTWYTGTWPIDNVITKGFGIDNFKKIEDDTRAGVSDHYPVVADISSYM